MKITPEEIETIQQAAKLWEGLEGQKQWHRGQPRLLNIINNAITHLRFEIILIAQTSLHPRKFKHLVEDD